MPPQIKVTKEQIVEAAFKMSREKGFESVTARKLAAELGCSTQPIFRCYENMDELKGDINGMAGGVFGEVLINSFSSSRPILAMAVNYVDFAFKEKNLFRMMFMEENSDGKFFTDLFASEGLDEILMNMSDMKEFSLVERRLIFMQTWIFAHGIASMVATGDLDLGEKDVTDLVNATVQQLMR